MAGTDTRVRIEVLNPGHKKPHAIVRVRVGSTDKGKPIFAAVKARLHRPLPEGSRIKWVYLLRRRVASTDHWYVQFTVSRAGGFGECDRAASGRVAVNLGWRKVADGLRVATWVGSDGESGELIIPESRLAGWTRSDTLRSTRDLNFNAAMSRLRQWLATSPTLPDWWKEKAAHMAQWKSPGRLASLLIHWRANRFDADAGTFDTFSELEAWRKQDKHLWLWEAHQRRNVVRWRNEFYRQFAVMLRRRYRFAVVDDTDRKKLARLPEPESESPVIAAARYNQRIASTGLLAQTIKAFGPITEAGEAKDITRTCHACGHAESFDAIRHLTRVCPKCGEVWDQDVNAAKNLLASAEAV